MSVVEAGGPAAIVRAMFQHWSSTTVIEQACRALRDLTKNGVLTVRDQLCGPNTFAVCDSHE